jgi:hypothetical protein
MGFGASGRFEHGHGRIVATQPAYGAAAYGARATEQHSVVLCGNAPAFGRGGRGCPVGEPGPLQITVEDVASRQGELGLQVQRGHHLQAWRAGGIASQAVVQWFGQCRLECVQRSLLGLFARPLGIGPEQSDRSVQAEERQSVIPGGCEFRVQDGCVGQRVAVDLAGL